VLGNLQPLPVRHILGAEAMAGLAGFPLVKSLALLAVLGALLTLVA
jgi:hypothetical protein